MKTELALIALLTLAGVALFTTETQSSFAQESTILNAFETWQSEHGRFTEQFEQTYRLSVFRENFLFVQQNNAQNSGLTLKMNKFAAMTTEEFAANKLTTIMESQVESTFEAENIEGLPSQVNWVTAGGVNAVQNQGSCGSCWAFSTVASMESLAFNQQGNLQKFSEQQVLSCTPAPFSAGCGGGNTFFGFSYTARAGIELESTYPYADVDANKASPCQYNKSKTVFQNKKAKAVAAGPKDLQAAVAQQVVSVSVDANSIYFQLYHQGVLSNDHCGTDLDHAINAVGYNMDAETPYWIVRNSWGADWGLNGYINIAVTEGDGVCGINMDNTIPV